ncbi:MAG: hypothetical protein AB8H79_20325 [Myxococcota bacterium]
MRAVLVLGSLLLLSSTAVAVEDPEEEECIDYAEHPAALKYVEPKALSGQLRPFDIGCLEEGYKASQRQTDKSKISRVLIANAMVTDTSQWASLVKRHLDEVEQSDPDVSYLYATHLFNRDTPDYNAVIRFADLAWDRRAERWTGRTFTVRSHHLLRLRAMARAKIWEAAEVKAAETSFVADADLATKRRLEAQTAAREWLDFDRASELRWFEAANVCMSTSSEQACGLREGWQERSRN